MKYLRQFLFLILGFIVLTALVGGSLLLYDTDGSKVGAPYGSLSGTPFKTYLVPALILLIVIGGGALTSMFMMIKHTINYPILCIAYAAVLLSFVLLEAIIMDTFNTLQVVYLLSGVLIVVIAILIRNQLQTNKPRAIHEATHSTTKKSTHHKHRHKKR